MRAEDEEMAAAAALASVSFANGNGTVPEYPHTDWEKEREREREQRNEARGKSLLEFMSSVVPHEPLVRGLLPRGMIYGMTGHTGHGKTTVATLLQVCVAMGKPFAGRAVVPGRVLVLCGENPDDYCWHLRAQLESFDIDPPDADCRFYVVDHVEDVSALLPMLHEAGQDDPFALVIVDTSVAFFMGEDENDNASMRAHAASLRRLTALPGHPAVLVLCHPSKHATRDNMQPRGGGAFLGELDGNWELWKPEGEDVATVRCGKARGISRFEPLHFEIVAATIMAMRAPDGSEIQSAVAHHLNDTETEEREAKGAADQTLLLRKLADMPDATQRELAHACGWSNTVGIANTGRVARVIRALADQRLIEQQLRKWRLTAAGKRAIGGS